MKARDLKKLKDLAAQYKAARTPDQELSDEMADYFGDMAWATAQRLKEELAADGWSVVSVTYKADGHASIELYRSDLLAAVKEGGGGMAERTRDEK